MQSVGFLYDLPPADGKRIEDGLKLKRRNCLFLPRKCLEMQPFSRPAHNGFKLGKRASAGTGLASRNTHHISHLVADEWLRAAIKHCEKQLVPYLTRRNGTVVLIDDLDDRKILKEMQSRVEGALPGYRGTLGCSEHVENFHPPGSFNTPTHFFCQRLSPGEDHLKRDV